MAFESAEQAGLRWEKLRLVQDHYKNFLDFLREVMDLLGFSVTRLQADIAQFVASGGQYIMVQAQRGQAKTTLTAAFAVWCLIHRPDYRVLIVSAGGKQASEISTLVIRLIMHMPLLECMRPDTANGDKSSVEHFDVHYTLKGVNKSPSVRSEGITANLQGARADLLIADDVESQKNSATAVMRAQLLHLTLDFTAINSTGRIIWLGTPQTSDSIYNTLPGRGVTVRIWPGRYPTPEQLPNYKEHLAPMLVRDLDAHPELGSGGGMDGLQGKPTDPQLLNEEALILKERDQGASYFQLQHMLNTALTDALRYPLKTEHMILMDYSPRMPLVVVRGMGKEMLRHQTVHGYGFAVAAPHSLSGDTAPLIGPVAYVDPAGGGLNADETAYAVVAFLNGTTYLLEVGGLPGGYESAVLIELAQRLARWRPTTVIIEKNMGFGAFREVFVPVLGRLHPCNVEDDLVAGQKERRIINTLEPVMGRGALVVMQNAIDRDRLDSQRYAPKDRTSYSFFYQAAHVTADRNSLRHDDRLDAVEGAVRHWQASLMIDQKRLIERAEKAAFKALVDDPLGHRRYDKPTRVNNTALGRRFKR